MKLLKNGQGNTLTVLAFCLLPCLLAASCFLISWQGKRITALAVRQMADILHTYNLSVDSLRKLASSCEDGPVRLSFFSTDLHLLAGSRIKLEGSLTRDLEFAVKSGLRIKDQVAGYEIVPQEGMVAVVTTNPAFLARLASDNWIIGTVAIFLLALMASAYAFISLTYGRQLSRCRDFLEEITQKPGSSTLSEMLSSARQKVDGYREKTIRLERQRLELLEETRKLQRSLRKTTQDLEEIQEHLLRAGTLSALGEFAAGISHELNNPMGIVLGFTQHLLDEVPPDHPHHSKLKRMETELGRCQRILQDLLAFARPQEPVFRRVDVNRLVNETVQFVFYPAIEGIEITCNLEENLPEIEVDPDQLEQILINLLKNAVQSIEKEGRIAVSTCSVTLTREDTVMLAAPVIQPGALLMEDPGSALSMRVPRMEGAAMPGDPAIKIDISDTGSGISPRDFKKIFTPFYTTKKDGTGLGLSICWKLVRRNLGILKVKSTQGTGTTFSIILPVREKKERSEHGS